MKSLCALVALALLASSASAADISRSSLAAIGLPGFVKMSDSDAMAVRGKGYIVTVSGSSTANGFAGSGHASNSYFGSLSGSSGSHVASGSNGSFVVAGLAVGSTSNSGAGGAIAIGLGAVAGGASSVSVH